MDARVGDEHVWVGHQRFSRTLGIRLIGMILPVPMKWIEDCLGQRGHDAPCPGRTPLGLDPGPDIARSGPPDRAERGPPLGRLSRAVSFWSSILTDRPLYPFPVADDIRGAWI